MQSKMKSSYMDTSHSTVTLCHQPTTCTQLKHSWRVVSIVYVPFQKDIIGEVEDMELLVIGGCF